MLSRRDQTLSKRDQRIPRGDLLSPGHDHLLSGTQQSASLGKKLEIFLVKTVILLLASLFCLAAAFPAAANAQSRSANFQGQWEWVIYAKSRDELPPAYRNERLRDVPAASVFMDLKQRGQKLTGDCDASRRFLARLEECEVDATVKGKTAELELQSSFGGKITVRLTRSGNRLHWKVIKSDGGEHYFPEDVYLWRVKRKVEKPDVEE